MAKFYSARSKTIPPLPWQTFALPFSIAFELVFEFVCGHLVHLASKITKQGVYKSRGYSGPARGILVFPMVLAPAGLATLFAIIHTISLFRILF